MSWTTEDISNYHIFAKEYVSSYSSKIDCADLAIATLVEFSAQKTLPVKLKFYQKGWEWLKFNPKADKASEFKSKAMRMLGALNIIDNTKPIPIGAAKSGDLIMTKWNQSLGHTRIIYSIKHDAKMKKYEVTWYQGNLPPVKPEKRVDYFSNISNVFGEKPRRWNFEQFTD